MADLLVRVRLSGPAPAVGVAAERLRLVLSVAGESADYPNHWAPGIRRYVDVVIPADDLLQHEVNRDG